MVPESDVPVELAERGDDANDNDKNASFVSGSNRTEELGEPTEDESEDEDVDFNPLLKENPSEEEASSSLSSEVDGLDADMVDSRYSSKKAIPLSAGPILQKLNCDHDSLGCQISNHEAENMGTHVSHVVGTCDRKDNKSRDSISISEPENGNLQEKENGGSSSGIDAVEPDTMTTSSRKPIIDLDDEDAICKRTRARYSLASFTLDELETFLQETDDDDDFQNVDEEEEYRKFLTAVLQGDDEGNPDCNDDDDDEDNDADFEIEIEEALESDVDDCMMKSKLDEEFVRSNRRPQTRQNRRQKSNTQNKKTLKEKGTGQLRPLLPVMPSAPVTSVPCMGASHPLNGFMAHQIGQLYSLIYEHVQLLIQIYSLCVLEPSRQHIASQVKGLLSELLHKRDLVLAWRNMPYPSSCFLPAYLHSTPSHENITCPPVENLGSSPQGNDGQSCRWFPSVGGPVLSVLDVGPLKLVGRYFEDVSNAVREHQRRCVETTNIYLEKQPLFPLPICLPFSELNHNVSKGDDPTPPDVSAVSPNPKLPKKTLAATLVESTKKQSVALVSRQIAKLAQPFYSLFNPALFPHKPPSSAVANRVLFTDAEDELLAMGIMDYNNDWKSIKQRLLPCKSEHQIFVRAKNRCSSKAPENPIKTVRKMKTSPLTEEEKARIHEGLKTFRLDWTSIWKFIVPYRDPNLLCRQWRIANGTQKSYKGDSNKKEKRRIYESNRRKAKTAAMENCPMESEKEDDQTEYSGGQNGSGEDCVENDNEAYLHEAFLADWRPISSGMISSKISASSLKSGFLPGDLSAERCCEVQDPCMPHSYAPSKSVSKSLVSESLLHSHTSRKRSLPNLVKLAPELPPVKLPPAVRVIPQAFLRNSQLGPSSAEGASTGSGHQNTLCDPSSVNRTSNLVKPIQDTLKIVNGTKERGSELDPQMHPLLFQSLEEGHLPCYPLNGSSSIPTFSFFPVAQHQINLAGARLKSFRSKGTVQTSSSPDFHPLLQRTSDVDVGSVPPTDPLLSTDLELSRDGYMGDGLDCHATRPTTLGSDAVDLNLDIHLNSASRKRKVPSFEGTEVNLTVPSASATELIEGAPLDPITSGSAEKASSAILGQNLDGSSVVNDNDGDQPLLGIVMEQEELSDSDEEMEDVEFECEEMTDSEGEESDNEHIVNGQNKEEADTALGTDGHGLHSNAVACETSEGIVPQSKGKTPRSDLVGSGKPSSRNSWLSLNSRGSRSSPQSRTKSTHTSAEGIPARSHPNRNCKKATSSTKSTPPRDLETSMSQAGPASPPSRKSRKQTSKNPSPLKTDLPVGTTSCTEEDGKV